MAKRQVAWRWLVVASANNRAPFVFVERSVALEMVDYRQRSSSMTMKPPHPGEKLKEEYLVPLGMSVNALAKELGIGRLA